MPDRSKKATILEDSEIIKVVGELSQLTNIIDKFYGLSQDELLSYESNGLAFCHTFNKIVLKAELGSGKTTLLKKYTHDLISKNISNPHKLIPVFCSLSATAFDSTKEIEDNIFLSSKIPIKDSSMMNKSKLVWLLDGFDEIENKNLKSSIFRWCINESKNFIKVILSSRPHALPAYFADFITGSINQFSIKQVKLFIQKYLKHDPAKADKLILAIEGSDELMNLSKTPLLLTLIIIMLSIYEPENLPKRKEEIYRKIIDLLLGEWDKAKSVNRTYSISDDKLRRRILQKVSYHLYNERKRAFTKEDFTSIIQVAIPSINLAIETSLNFFNDLLRDCIIIPLSFEKYGFFHFSIQEYLAAEELANDIDTRRIWRTVEEYFGSGGWWKEVLYFYAGIKRDVGFLLNDLNRHLATNIINDHKNKELTNLIWTWLSVADLTDIRLLNPRGTVARALYDMKIGDDYAKWKKLSKI